MESNQNFIAGMIWTTVGFCCLIGICIGVSQCLGKYSLVLKKLKETVDKNRQAGRIVTRLTKSETDRIEEAIRHARYQGNLYTEYKK